MSSSLSPKTLSKALGDDLRCKIANGMCFSQNSYKNVGTFSVRSGLLCRVWTDSDDCSSPPGGVAMLTPPGTDTLHDYNGQDIGGGITAFRCQQCDACVYP